MAEDDLELVTLSLLSLKCCGYSVPSYLVLYGANEQTQTARILSVEPRTTSHKAYSVTSEVSTCLGNEVKILCTSVYAHPLLVELDKVRRILTNWIPQKHLRQAAEEVPTLCTSLSR